MMSEIYTLPKQKQNFSGLNILMDIFLQCETNPISGTRGSRTCQILIGKGCCRAEMIEQAIE